nr:uncharacterized protein LOC105324497 [Crassostrea gigas]
MSSREATLPPYTMSSMVIYAIHCSPQKALTLSEICMSLEAMFHVYGGNDKAWYNKVRNVLSKNTHFVKMRHPNNSGKSLWTVDLSLVPLTSFRKQTTRKESHNGWPNLLHQYLGVLEIELRGVVSSQLSFGIDRILSMSPRTSKTPTADDSILDEDACSACDSFYSVFDTTYDESDSVHGICYSSMERFRGYSDVSSSKDIHEFGHSTRIVSDSSMVSLDAPCSPIEPELSQEDIFAGVEELQSLLEPEDVIDFAPSDDSVIVSPADSYSLSALESIADFVIQCPGDFLQEFEPYLRDLSD